MYFNFKLFKKKLLKFFRQNNYTFKLNVLVLNIAEKLLAGR